MSKYSEILRNYTFQHGEMMLEKFNIVKEDWSGKIFGFIENEHGDVYGFGENDCGQLGLGHNDDVIHEQKIEELSGKEINLKKIYEGDCCIFAQTVDGVIYSWGSNKWGKLGNRDSNEHGDFYKPKKIEFKVTNQEVAIVDIKCGSRHNLALSIDGKVFGWGDNHVRQITEDVHGMSPIISKPVLMTPIKVTMKSIYCYDKTSFMITTDNEVYYYGRDIWGIRPTVMNDNDLIQHDYIPPMKLDFQAEALICNDDFIFYIITNNLEKIELYKYRNYEETKLADVDQLKKVKHDFIKQQSCSDLPGLDSSSIDKSQHDLSQSSTNITFIDFSLCTPITLGVPRRPIMYNGEILLDHREKLSINTNDQLKKVKHDFTKQQSCSDSPTLKSPSTVGTQQHLLQSAQSISFTNITLSSLCSLSAPPRKLIKFHDEFPMEQTETPLLHTTDETSKSHNTTDKVYTDKYTKLISILNEIINELEEKINSIKINLKSYNNKYAINLSSCTFLWDQAYEIIDDDDYEDLNELEEKINSIKINLTPYNNEYAINLSPCTFLWDQAYEIIDDDDYEDLNELEEKINSIKINLKSYNNKYAINLSPCSYLWDEAYNIIDDDNYKDLCHLAEEKVPKNILGDYYVFKMLKFDVVLIENLPYFHTLNLKENIVNFKLNDDEVEENTPILRIILNNILAIHEQNFRDTSVLLNERICDLNSFHTILFDLDEKETNSLKEDIRNIRKKIDNKKTKFEKGKFPNNCAEKLGLEQNKDISEELDEAKCLKIGNGSFALVKKYENESGEKFAIKKMFCTGKFK